MQKQNEMIARRPFDLYQLHLIRLVAECGGFTGAARAAGLTQSAITRQVQGVEQQLGTSLFRRTTREVRLTSAGAFLLRESRPLLGEVDVLLRRLREDYADAPREVRVGVSRSVSLAYLPGFFAVNAKQAPAILSRVVHEASANILASLDSDALDVGVMPPPARLSSRLRIAHRFRDQFTLIGHAGNLAAAKIDMKSRAAVRRFVEEQPWLALHDFSLTGRRLVAWLRQQKLQVRPTMALDNFDLIINLVAMGFGASIVPQRALALYSRRQSLVRLPWPRRFVRELAIVVRRQREMPAHIEQFVENILY